VGVTERGLHQTVSPLQDVQNTVPNTIRDVIVNILCRGNGLVCKFGSNLATYGSSMSCGTCRSGDLMYYLVVLRNHSLRFSRRNRESTSTLSTIDFEMIRELVVREFFQRIL
jgi:hypothetical protein